VTSAQVQVTFDGAPSIGLSAVVGSVATDPPQIALAEPVQGFTVISLSEETRVSFLNGGTATLEDFGPGQWLWAAGFRGDAETLAATQVVLIEEGGVPTAAEVRTIALDEPLEGATVASPIRLRGRVSATPFEGTLVARVFDATDALVAEVPFIVDGEMGEPADFAAEIAYATQHDGPGRVDVVEFSAQDGSVVAIAERSVVLVALPDFMLVGRVELVSVDARVISLAETIEGFDLVAITDDTVVLDLEGSEIALVELQPGTKIEVIGQPGDPGTLMAAQIQVLP
jgi:hypothetical protein